jgi:hypothetical protein
MSYARQMLDSHPRTSGLDVGVLAATIDALTDCAQACTADVDADLGERDLAEMVTCIRLCLDYLHRRCRGGMPGTFSTAGSALRHAGAASRPAGSFWMS